MLASRVLSCFFVFAVATVGLSQEKQEKKTFVDPSGTWRWDFDSNGTTIKNVLKLEATSDGKVTGALSARDMKMDVIDGKITDGKLTFQIKAETPRSFKLLFDGKVDGDKVEGKVDASSDQGAIELPWTAKRSVEPSDVVGTWKFKVTLPDGLVLQPLLKVTHKEDKFEATMSSDDGKSVEAKKLQVKDNELRFEIDTKYEGNDLLVSYRGRPYGSKIKGTLEYSTGGNSGELEFTGEIQPEKK